MVVFQKVTTTGNDKAGQAMRKIAAVKTKNPKYQQVLSGIKGYGHLEAGYAMLRLQLRKDADCESEFTCQAEGIDSQGRERVSTTHLLQQPKEGGKDDEDLRSFSTPMSVQLLSIVQQIAVKTALVERSQQGLENQINVLEHRLEDKIDTGFEKINDKLWEIESKKSALSSDSSHSKAVERVQDNKTLFDILGSTKRLEHILEGKTDLSSFLSINKTETHSCEQMFQFLSENLTAQIGEFSNGYEALTTVMEDQMTEVTDNFNTFLQSLEESLNDSMSMIPSYPPELFAALNSLVGNVTDSPKSCKRNQGLKYKQEEYFVIKPSTYSTLNVPYLCDMGSDGGGWIVIQRRTKGDTNFFLDWEDYKEGFGTLETDFWLGNDNIHTLTSVGLWELRVTLKFEGKTRFADYKNFSLGNEDTNYKLHVGSYSGTAGDSLSRHNGHPFTTKDKDNDDGDSRNCAKTFEGAWWYINCHDSNLNGRWMSTTAHHGLMWRALTDSDSATYSEMKIRQVDP